MSTSGVNEQVASTLRQHVMQRYDGLSVAERRVADTVLGRGTQLLDDTIATLAKNSGVSEPTVVRFCRSLGFSGMKELKRAAIPVAAAVKPSSQSTALSQIASEDDIVSFVVHHKQEVLRETARTLDRQRLSDAIKLLVATRVVKVAGVGGSAVVVRHVQHYFRRIGIQCSTYSVYQAEDIAVERYASGDVVLAISYSGNNPLVVDIVADARSKGASVICIVPWGQSRLQALADVALHTPFDVHGVIPGHHGLERTAQIAVVDMLFTGLFLAKGIHTGQ